MGGTLLAALAGTAVTLWSLDRKAEATYRDAWRRMVEAGKVVPNPLAFVPPALDPGANGADLYLEAFQLTTAHFHDYSESQLKTTFAGDPRLREDAPGALEPEAWKEIEALVRDHGKTIEILLRAAAVPHCRFPMEYGQGWNTLMPQIRYSIAAARLLAWDVRARLRAGKPDGVWERIDAVFAIDRAVSTEPMLVSQLARCAVREIGLDLVREALPSILPPSGTVDALARRLDPEEFRRAFRLASLYEIAMVVDSIDGWFAGRTTVDVADRDLAGPIRWLSRPRMKEAAARAFDRYGRLRPALDGPRDLLIDRAVGIEREFRGDPLSWSFLVAAYPKHWRRQVALETRGLLAIEAARIKSRYPTCERLPESLPGLPADPLSGKPIRYRRVECGFFLELDLDPEELRARWGIEELPVWECTR